MQSKFLLPLFIGLSISVLGCSSPTGSPDQLSKPGQVALQVLSDTTLAITWHGEFEKYDSVIIQRKAGEAGWRTN
ncbi:MAG: hypothetical protein V1681_07020, partial [Candidatus Neomarinimicrobiota bacterium]